MNAVKILAVVLIVAGILALVYGSFSYTKETHNAKLEPIEISVKDKESVNVPVWAGVGAIVVGGALLLLGKKGWPSLECDFGLGVRPSNAELDRI